VISVPVVAPDNWLREGEKQPQAKVEKQAGLETQARPEKVEPEPVKAPAPPRFMSQDEDSGADDAFFYSSAVPPVATTVTVSAPPRAAQETAVEIEDHVDAASSPGEFDAEFNQEPAPEPAIFDSVPEAQTVAGSSVEESGTHCAETLFEESQEQPQRDLDVPAFMRRLRF
jgi:hypothetical protein